MGNQANRALLKALVTRPDFVLWAGVGTILLATIYYWLLLQVTTIETLAANLVLEPVYLAVVVLLAPATLVLFGMNLSTAIFLFRSGGRMQWSGGALLGSFLGGFGAACPVCGAFLLSLLGVTAGLTALPFAGLEFWVVATGMMLITFWKSSTALAVRTCHAGQLQTQVCWQLPQVKQAQVSTALVILVGLLGLLAWMVASNELRF